MLYINVYECQQVYGGPEEGGWWFDAEVPVYEDATDYSQDFPIQTEGQPISFTAKRGRQALRIARRLEKKYPFSRNRYTSAANFDGNYRVAIEKNPPQAWDNYQPYS